MPNANACTSPVDTDSENMDEALQCTAMHKHAVLSRTDYRIMYFTGYREIVASIFPLPLYRIVVSRIKPTAEINVGFHERWNNAVTNRRRRRSPREPEKTARKGNKSRSRGYFGRENTNNTCTFPRIWEIAGSCFPCSNSNFYQLFLHWYLSTTQGQTNN